MEVDWIGACPSHCLYVSEASAQPASRMGNNRLSCLDLPLSLRSAIARGTLSKYVTSVVIFLPSPYGSVRFIARLHSIIRVFTKCVTNSHATLFNPELTRTLDAHLGAGELPVTYSVAALVVI